MAIIHSMVMYQQQDYKGRLINVIRDIDHNNVQSFREEIVEEEIAEDQAITTFDLKQAHGHVWTIYKSKIIAAPCFYGCSCCEKPLLIAKRDFLV